MADMVKVEALAALASPGWHCERGDVIDVPLADARRLIQRGLAKEIKEHPLPRASAADLAAARVLDVETAERFTDPDNQLETGVRVRPRGSGPKSKAPSKPGRVPAGAAEDD